ncbi:MAG: sigma 54-interacting transcriptional regulator [Cyclonatronaceae bacterium]
MSELTSRREGQRYMWIPGGLTARCENGNPFKAEATLSCYNINGEIFFSLILRNVSDRMEADRKITALEAETEYLREELKAIRQFDDIVGRSGALMRVLKDVEQVAPTDASVLIYGETGTDKELIVRAVHDYSNRRDQALVKGNCAAIPASLIESEFFGHDQ